MWWFTVVGAALVVNLLSSFLKPKLDSWASNTSSWWRNRSEFRKEKWEREVTNLSCSQIAIQVAIGQSLRAHRKCLEARYFCLALLIIEILLWSLRSSNNTVLIFIAACLLLFVLFFVLGELLGTMSDTLDKKIAEVLMHRLNKSLKTPDADIAWSS